MAISPANATTTDAKPPKVKGSGAGASILIVLAATVGAAAGGFGAVIAAGSLGLGSANGGHARDMAAPAVSAVEYIEIDQAFTSNLSDTGRYLQVRLSLSQRGGPAVAAAITRHKPALVSAVLGVLGEASEADVASRQAKDRLRARLKTIINDTLKQNGTAGRIDDVFFTSLVVQ